MTEATKLLDERSKGAFAHVINGTLLNHGQGIVEVVDPATGNTLATVTAASTETLDLAVDYARLAFTSWKKTTWAERTSLLRRWADAFAAESQDMAALLCAEQGKSIGTSLWEVGAALHWIQETPAMELKEHVVFETDDTKAVQRYAPIGVCGGIVPWNFPVLLMMFKIVPALLAGNVVIIKPSPFTPLATIRIVQTAQAVFPPGVLQCIVGHDSLGPWMTEHPGIDRIAFTGSTETGKLVARSCASTLKRVSLELGGNDAAIIMADVEKDEISKVAEMMIKSTFMNTGQWCQASKRIYVHEEVYDRFLATFKTLLDQSSLGPWTDKETTHGPLNNRRQWDKVNELLEDARQQQYTMVEAGRVKAEAHQGLFLPFTVVDNPPEQSRIVQEEPFGPIVPLLRWSDEVDLIERVNASPYGLGAIIHGRDESKMEDIARQLEVGTVWKNMIQYSDPRVPFHGWKSSGYGGENGREALISYSNVQVIFTAK